MYFTLFYSMQKIPADRPTPETLLHHAFIRTYDDGNKQIIAEWVCRSLQEIRLTGVAGGQSWGKQQLIQNTDNLHIYSGSEQRDIHVIWQINKSCISGNCEEGQL